MKYLILFVAFFVSPLSSANDWPDMSVYHLDGTWTKDDGKGTKFSELSGKPSVVAMVYTTCQHTCPMITSKIQQIRKSIPEDLQNKARYVLISFDPERDTPSALNKYRKKRKLDEHWVLLTSNNTEVRKVAGVLGVNFKKTPDGEFSHSNVIALLDKNGVVVTKIERLNQDTKLLEKKLKEHVK